MSGTPGADEREVLGIVLETLGRVDSDARARILRSVSVFLGLEVCDQPRRISTAPHPVADIPAEDREPMFADRPALTPKGFLHDKRPRTDVERVACLAYYLAHYGDARHFKTIDISKLNTQAAQLKISNPTQAVANAAARGLLAPAGKGMKQISAIGERFVDALPNRSEAKAVLDRMRPRRGRKKRRNAKKPVKVKG